MPTINLTVTDEQDAAVSARSGKTTQAYFQTQVNAICETFVADAKRDAFAAVGLSPVLADAKLDAEQEALLIADAGAKKEAADLAAAEVAAAEAKP